MGITHRVSCPHTHQQNGSAERKHRHIVETGLAHASMPIKFWDEAFLTVTFLINRMPTRVIDNTCPLQRLFHTPPNYSFLKIFGCACWPHLRPYNKHKLSFRSKECVFLGYSTLHKGYKCLDLDSGRVYVSRDVIFDENVFPFSRPVHNSSAFKPSTSSNENIFQMANNGVNLGYDHMYTLLPLASLDAGNLATPATDYPAIAPAESAPGSVPAPASQDGASSVLPASGDSGASLAPPTDCATPPSEQPICTLVPATRTAPALAPERELG
jgi:hypothetical protein